MGMQPQPGTPEITPQVIQNGILSMKKSLSQIEGECNTMRGDAQSAIFNNMANICGKLIQQSEALKKANEEFVKMLEKIYQAHPEIKIAMVGDKKAKTKETISERVSVKVREK